MPSNNSHQRLSHPCVPWHDITPDWRCDPLVEREGSFVHLFYVRSNPRWHKHGITDRQTGAIKGTGHNKGTSHENPCQGIKGNLYSNANPMFVLHWNLIYWKCSRDPLLLWATDYTSQHTGRRVSSPEIVVLLGITFILWLLVTCPAERQRKGILIRLGHTVNQPPVRLCIRGRDVGTDKVQQSCWIVHVTGRHQLRYWYVVPLSRYILY